MLLAAATATCTATLCHEAGMAFKCPLRRTVGLLNATGLTTGSRDVPFVVSAQPDLHGNWQKLDLACVCEALGSSCALSK